MTKKILLLVAVLVCTISSNSYALFSYNYDTKLDKHVQLINDYLRMKPHNETLLIKALAKKVMQVYSPEKEKEIYYYNQIISRIDRKSPVTCKQEPYVSDGRKSLETYLQNKRYEVKTNSCMIW